MAGHASRDSPDQAAQTAHSRLSGVAMGSTSSVELVERRSWEHQLQLWWRESRAGSKPRRTAILVGANTAEVRLVGLADRSRDLRWIIRAAKGILDNSREITADYVENGTRESEQARSVDVRQVASYLWATDDTS